jgi:hypothetical protein
MGVAGQVPRGVMNGFLVSGGGAGAAFAVGDGVQAVCHHILPAARCFAPWVYNRKIVVTVRTTVCQREPCDPPSPDRATKSLTSTYGTPQGERHVGCPPAPTEAAHPRHRVQRSECRGALLRANRSKGRGAEPRGYSGFRRHASRAASDAARRIPRAVALKGAGT